MIPGTPTLQLTGISLCDIEASVAEGVIKRRHVQHLKDFLLHFEDAFHEGSEMQVADIKNYVFGVLGYKRTTITGYNRLNEVMNTYRIFYEDGPFLASFARGVAAVYNEVKPPKEMRKKVEPKFCAPIEEVPVSLRAALDEMQRGYEGVNRSAPSPRFFESIAFRVRGLVKACRDAKVAPALEVECIKIYERSLLSREKPLRRTTIRSSLNAIRDVARYVGSDPDVVQYLSDRVRYHERIAAKDLPLKELKILRIPSYKDIFERAFDLLGQAEDSRHIAQRFRLRNYACAVVLSLPCPFRAADSRLVFGDTLNWTGSTWRIDIPVTEKTGEAFRVALLPLFRVFIDQLVLQGASEVYLDELREAALNKRRALYEDHLGRPIAAGYVSKAWYGVFGTGSHIARTKIHDEFARLGPAGVEAAMAACGHRSHRSAEHYRTQAFQLLASEHIKTTASDDIREDEWKRFFTMHRSSW